MKEKTGRKDLPTVRDTELEPGSLLWECLQAIEIENFVIDFFFKFNTCTCILNKIANKCRRAPHIYVCRKTTINSLSRIG